MQRSVQAVEGADPGLDHARKLSTARGIGGAQVDWVLADMRDYRPSTPWSGLSEQLTVTDASPPRPK